jgi:hypothetical protein
MNPVVKKIYDSVQANQNFIEIASPNTNTFTFQHRRADSNGLNDNLQVAKELNANGFSVIIREHIRNSHGRKNPEYELVYPDGQIFISDLKTPNPKKYQSLATSVKNSFTSARKQKARHAVIKLLDVQASLDALEAGINNGFRKEGKHQEVIMIRQGKCVVITRKNYENGEVGRELEHIF